MEKLELRNCTLKCGYYVVVFAIPFVLTLWTLFYGGLQYYASAAFVVVLLAGCASLMIVNAYGAFDKSLKVKIDHGGIRDFRKWATEPQIPWTDVADITLVCYSLRGFGGYKLNIVLKDRSTKTVGISFVTNDPEAVARNAKVIWKEATIIPGEKETKKEKQGKSN